MAQTYGRLTWWQWVLVIAWVGMASPPSGFAGLLGAFVMAYALVLFAALAHRNYIAGHADTDENAA